MATLLKIVDVGSHPILPPSSQVAIAIENEVISDELQRPNDDLTEEKVYLEDEILSEMNFEGIVGKSAALHRALKEVEIVAPTDSGVTIRGETGTGKELIARAIHNRSSRRHQPFVKVNCAAIPSGLPESGSSGMKKEPSPAPSCAKPGGSK
jgi:formate hydrogenlyase transcriptional activator